MDPMDPTDPRNQPLEIPGAANDPRPSGPALQTAALSTTLNPRLAPQDLEAERSVLGGILLTNDALYDVAEVVKPEDFYREPHRKIFAAMQDMALRSEPIDVTTLGDQLRKGGELDAVGGPAYLASLDASVPATANLTRYAKIVRDKARLRRLIETAHAIAREGYEQLGEADEMIDRAEARLLALCDGRESESRSHALREVIRRVFVRMETLYERQSDVTGIPTGFEALDQATAGWQRGDLIILAGRPSMGKTSAVMNMATHVAVDQNLPVLVFSLEMSADALGNRLFASEARVDGHRIRTGKLLDSDWPKLARAADRLARGNMIIRDSRLASVLDMRAEARRVKVKHPGLALIVIDYIQLVRGSGKTDNREQEVSEISRGLKALAGELDVPVIALSQLNRSLERREDKRPVLSDLRESGAIEQDADVIAFIYRDEVYNKDSADKGIAEIILGKQRNGPTGTVRVAFLRDYTRFENLDEWRDPKPPPRRDWHTEPEERE